MWVESHLLMDVGMYKKKLVAAAKELATPRQETATGLRGARRRCSIGDRSGRRHALTDVFAPRRDGVADETFGLREGNAMLPSAIAQGLQGGPGVPYQI